jgi:hypothetical protein
VKELSLSASVLGSNCLRRLWYIAHGEKGKEVEEGLRRIFEIGVALEPLAIEWERRKGREVFYNAKSHQDDPDFILEVGKGGVVGRFDAIFDKEILIDIKTCNSRKFAELLEDNIPRGWLVQVNVYFWGLKLGCVREDIKELVESIRKVGIYGVHKGSGRTVEVVRDPNLEIFEEALKKAVEVFGSGDVRELKVDVSECSRCEFFGVVCNL